MRSASLPHLQRYLSEAGRRGIGRIGEELVYEKLTAKGEAVAFTHPKQRQGDLIVFRESGEVVRIEVKTARRGKDRKWRFTLEKTGCTSAQNADLLVLLAITTSGDFIPFVLPVSAIAGRRHIVITSQPERYGGQFAQFRQRRGDINLEVAL